MRSVSQMIAEIEDWLEMMTNGCYLITRIDIHHLKDETVCSVNCIEDPYTNPEYYELKINDNGIIINEDNENVIEVSKGAYDNDPDMLEMIREFEENWALAD